jgi:hypothetical protein
LTDGVAEERAKRLHRDIGASAGAAAPNVQGGERHERAAGPNPNGCDTTIADGKFLVRCDGSGWLPAARAETVDAAMLNALTPSVPAPAAVSPQVAKIIGTPPSANWNALPKTRAFETAAFEELPVFFDKPIGK